MQNSCNIIGRLVVNPELKTTSGGTQFVKGRIACQRDYPKNNGQPNAQGYKEYETDFIPFSIWGKNAAFAATLVSGQMIALNGRWQTSQYQDQQGNKQTGHELNVDSYYALDKKNKENGNNNNNNNNNNNGNNGNNGFNQQPPQNNGFGQNQGSFNQQPPQQGFYQPPQQQGYQAPPPNGNGGFNPSGGFNQPNNFNQPTNFNQ